MATKTANVMARVEPSVKEQAEAIMEMLGIPASVVINALYKQIIMTRSIPFSLAVLSCRSRCAGRPGRDGRGRFQRNDGAWYERGQGRQIPCCV